MKSVETSIAAALVTVLVTGCFLGCVSLQDSASDLSDNLMETLKSTDKPAFTVKWDEPAEQGAADQKEAQVTPTGAVVERLPRTTQPAPPAFPEKAGSSRRLSYADENMNSHRADWQAPVRRTEFPADAEPLDTLPARSTRTVANRHAAQASPVARATGSAVSDAHVRLVQSTSADPAIPKNPPVLLLNDGTSVSSPINKTDFVRDFKLQIPAGTFEHAEEKAGTLVLFLGKKRSAASVAEGDINGKTLDEISPDVFGETLDLQSIANTGKREPISLTWIPDVTDDGESTQGEPQSTDPLYILIDTEPPVLASAPYLNGDPATGVALVLEFSESDLDETSVKNGNNYKIEMGQADGSFDDKNPIIPAEDNIDVEDRTVRIFLGRPPTGTYRITLNPSPETKADFIKDRAGNDLVTVARQYNSLPGPERGEHVQYPEFLQTRQQPDAVRLINPGDRVETTVVRLFYTRDAHRVAQILNRTTRSLNRAAVTQARRRAEDARDNADELTDERRAKEREAVRDAEQLRGAEHQLAAARQAKKRSVAITGQSGEIDQQIEQRETLVSEQQALLGDDGQPINPGDNADAINAKIRDLKAEIKGLEDQKRQLAREGTALNELSDQEDVDQLQGEVGRLQEIAARSNEEAIQTRAKEDRARESQFRQEVAAAHEDPDTFAAGSIDSVDPVAQVSISVIGEGLIQLRGPRSGIDRMRTAIHQIDAPLGQVKVEVVTVQLNGERGDRMERPLGRIEAQIGMGRFLTSQSLLLLKRSIQEVATQVAMENDQGGHFQVDRDRKYMYSFFGRDFIDELYEMDSEFLRSQNKLLGLNSMDTISMHQAFFTLALARNDVRHRILNLFMEKVRCELVEAEFDYRRTSELHPHTTRSWPPKLEKSKSEMHFRDAVDRNNRQRYHFRNTLAFFGGLECATDAAAGDTLSPVQREFIRLAQIFKARLINELELKQRIIERTMIESRRLDDLNVEEAALNDIREQVICQTKAVQSERFLAASGLTRAVIELQTALAQAIGSIDENLQITLAQATKAHAETAELRPAMMRVLSKAQQEVTAAKDEMGINAKQTEMIIGRAIVQLKREFRPVVSIIDTWEKSTNSALANIDSNAPKTERLIQLSKSAKEQFNAARSDLSRFKRYLNQDDPFAALINLKAVLREGMDQKFTDTSDAIARYASAARDVLLEIEHAVDAFEHASDVRSFDYERLVRAYRELRNAQRSLPEKYAHIRDAATRAFCAVQEFYLGNRELEVNKHFLRKTRSSLERRKLLDFLIEEQEQKVIDLLEGTRAQIAAVDNYLKRLSIALEDDFKHQFYDPAFVRIRSAAREWDVTLGQVERTSILTNNRAFAKVTPQATMEFDLPKRNLAVVEALDGAKALAKDYGALLQDPTFLAAAQLQGLRVPNGQVQNVVPGLPASTDEHRMGTTPKGETDTGAALQSLVPDPSVYKFETGTGYEIRPVIQPDGHSIVYDFNYMYTTNIREPVRADEKHLGRIKRHFINTQVQTSSFELREVSRYQVALKAARTAQGVPLLQDIPGVGALFRPLPSAESSIQQNVILASSVVYPTLYDLMGLRWAPSVVDLDHVSVRDAEHVVRGRYKTVTDSVFDTSTGTVDEILGIPYDQTKYYRRDLYHRQRRPSPYHPGGYTHETLPANEDPTGEGFEVEDRRPIEMRQPPYDRRFRKPIRYEELPAEVNVLDDRTIPRELLQLENNGL